MRGAQLTICAGTCNNIHNTLKVKNTSKHIKHWNDKLLIAALTYPHVPTHTHHPPVPHASPQHGPATQPASRRPERPSQHTGETRRPPAAGARSQTPGGPRHHRSLSGRAEGPQVGSRARSAAAPGAGPGHHPGWRSGRSGRTRTRTPRRRSDGGPR